MSLSSLVRAAASSTAPLSLPLTVSDYVLADQGAYFVAASAVAGTASAAAPTAYSDTAPLFTLFNASTAGDPAAKSYYLDYVRAYQTSLGTGATSLAFKAVLDTTAPTGGTLLTAVNVNMTSSATSKAAPRVFPTGIAQTANSRVPVVNQIVIPTQTAPMTLNSEVFIGFGGVEGVNPTYSIAAGTNVVKFSYNWPPMIIGPQQSFSLQFILTLQSATSSWAVEVGWLEA